MEYTVKQLADLSGITPRTLRWYDQQGILHPGRTSQAGYRFYGEAEVDRLQQILFYRELGFELSAIRDILNAPDFDRQTALQSHLSALKERREQLDALILTVTKTLKSVKGEQMMTDQEKFEHFKRDKITDNEKKYGAELREKYGSDVMDASNRQFAGLTTDEYKNMEKLEAEIRARLENAVESGADAAGESGLSIAALHREWLCFTWPSYSLKAHAGLAQMYLTDERFTAYYDAKVSGCAKFLHDAILSYTNTQNQ